MGETYRQIAPLDSVKGCKELSFDQTYRELKTDFCDEKEMCDYIEKHIHKFCTDLLGVTLKSYKREYPVAYMRTGRGNRVDFYIETIQKENIFIECKVAKASNVLTSAIGQLLGYNLECSKTLTVHRSVLVTNIISSVSIGMIRKFKLPVELIAMEQERAFVLSKIKNYERSPWEQFLESTE